MRRLWLLLAALVVHAGAITERPQRSDLAADERSVVLGGICLLTTEVAVRNDVATRAAVQRLESRAHALCRRELAVAAEKCTAINCDKSDGDVLVMRNDYGVALLLGIVVGAAIIAVEALTTIGPLTLIPYAVLFLAVVVYARRRVVRRFARRFAIAWIAFMLATVVAFVWILTIANPAAVRYGLWNNSWPLLVMAGIACVTSAIVAFAGKPATV